MSACASPSVASSSAHKLSVLSSGRCLMAHAYLATGSLSTNDSSVSGRPRTAAAQDLPTSWLVSLLGKKGGWIWVRTEVHGAPTEPLVAVETARLNK